MKKRELQAEIERLRQQINALQARVFVLEAAQRSLPAIPNPLFPGHPYVTFRVTDADRTTGIVKRWTKRRDEGLVPPPTSPAAER